MLQDSGFVQALAAATGLSTDASLILACLVLVLCLRKLSKVYKAYRVKKRASLRRLCTEKGGHAAANTLESIVVDDPQPPAYDDAVQHSRVSLGHCKMVRRNTPKSSSYSTQPVPTLRVVSAEVESAQPAPAAETASTVRIDLTTRIEALKAYLLSENIDLPAHTVQQPSRLASLSPCQLEELWADVFTQSLKRIGRPDDLRRYASLHPVRKEAINRIASLSDSIFHRLAQDVLAELVDRQAAVQALEVALASSHIIDQDTLKARMVDTKGLASFDFGELCLSKLEPTRISRNGSPALEFEVYLFQNVFIAVKQASHSQVKLKGRIFVNSMTNVDMTRRDGICNLDISYRDASDNGVQMFTILFDGAFEATKWENSLRKLTIDRPTFTSEQRSRRVHKLVS